MTLILIAESSDKIFFSQRVIRRAKFTPPIFNFMIQRREKSNAHFFSFKISVNSAERRVEEKLGSKRDEVFTTYMVESVRQE